MLTGLKHLENLLVQQEISPAQASSSDITQMCEPGRATEEEGAVFCGECKSYNLTDLWDTNCLARQ